ncbi:MAG: tetratricopeptide repeat protein [Chitinispirillaceae bacterium]|nr:tetratricopeptide repeat protein [Chitinispirillaceae bacterium]
MNIKYSKQKQEIREDPIIDSFFKAKEFFLRNTNMLIGVMVVIVFLAGFIIVYNQMRRSSLIKAEDSFGRAMIAYTNQDIEKAVENFRIVADNHRTTPQGIMSAHILGGIFLSMRRFDDAIKWFEVAAKEAEKELGFIAGSANEALGSCYEGKGDFPRAFEYFEKALDDNRIAFRHGAIRWKMALISKKMDKLERARALCTEILADTTAVQYRPNAENMIAVLDATSG